MIEKKCAPPTLGTTSGPHALTDILRILASVIGDLYTAQRAKVTGLRFVRYDRSGAGLGDGEVWVDENGILRMVVPQIAHAPSFEIQSALGTVVTT